jgi:3-hydroxyacyl-[acyl-carrier-protein] dehydratase
MGPNVKFVLVDSVSELEPGRRIVAHKAVSLAEEYLADHFPTFPVLPGVLMLEALVQASAWLVRATLDFAPGIIVLHEARNVTYKSFVAPGEVLTIESTCKELDAGHSSFAATGQSGGREVVKAQLKLRHLNLADLDAGLADVDAANRVQQRRLLERLRAKRPATAAAAASG